MVDLTVVTTERLVPVWIEVRVDFSPPPGAVPFIPPSIRITWGDGSYSDFMPSTPSGSITTQHHYENAGTYIITVTARWGGTDVEPGPVETDSETITLVERPPEVVPIPPPTPPPVPIVPPERPVEVVIQPPDQPPKPIELPPEGPPPQHPPKTPPTQLPPPISPRETDMETFRRFLERWGHQLDWVSVNVPLDGGEYVQDLEEPWRSLWARLTQHKADVVFERKGVIYVAEIKPRLSRGAIGEALLAWLMYNRIYKPTKPTKAAVICMTASPLLLQPAGWAGVLVFVTDAIDGTGWFGEVRVRHKMPRTLPSVE